MWLPLSGLLLCGCSPPADAIPISAEQANRIDDLGRDLSNPGSKSIAIDDLVETLSQLSPDPPPVADIDALAMALQPCLASLPSTSGDYRGAAYSLFELMNGGYLTVAQVHQVQDDLELQLALAGCRRGDLAQLRAKGFNVARNVGNAVTYWW
jgi:hypothetical protein